MYTNQLDSSFKLSSKYSSTILKTISIPSFASTIKKIISSSISYNIISYSLIQDTNTLKVIIDVNINIIYSSKLNTTLLSKYFNTIIVEYLYLPKILGGNDVTKHFIKNIIKVKISNMDTFSNFISPDLISLSIYFVIDIIFPNCEYITYVLHDGFHDSLNSSFSARNDSLKNIYQSKFFLRNLKWNDSKNTILFLEFSDNVSYISSFDFSKNMKHEMTNCNIYKKIICFTFINSSNVVFYNQSQKNSFFYILNINTNQINQLPLEVASLTCEHIHYNQVSKLLYFSTFKNNNCNLYSYDLKNNVELIFETSNLCNFVVDDKTNNCIIKIIDSSLEKLILINLTNNSFINIDFDFNYISIKKFIFYKSSKTNYCIVILLKLPFGFKLIKYNINTCMLETIYCSQNITDFEVDTNTNDIIVVTRNNHISEVINLSFNNNLLLKTSCFIKEISIKSRF